MGQETFNPLPADYVIAALRAGCGIRYDWASYGEEDLRKIAVAAAAGRARLEFVVPSGADIPLEKLQSLGESGQGYVTMDFSQGY